MGKYRTKGSIALIITGSVLILVLAGLYLGRNGILCRTADKRILYAEQKYGLSICYEDLRMKGLNEIELKNLSIVPRNRDTLLTLHTLLLLKIAVGAIQPLHGSALDIIKLLPLYKC